MVHKLYFQGAVSENVLLIDGLPRVGKGLIAPLVSDLPGVEFPQLRHPVDHIPVLWRLGLLEDQSAASFLRMTVDGFLYDRMIGRHLNTRQDDFYTSIHWSLNKKEILAREFGGEGQEVVDQFNADGKISTFITHHSLPMADLWFKAYPKLKVVHLVRHPVDVCFSWNKPHHAGNKTDGWGDRLGKDPLAFWPVAEHDGEPVPWYAVDFAEEYNSLSPLNRLVKCFLELDRLYDETIAAFDDARKQQVKTLVFDRIATEPEREIGEIAAWLDTTLHPEISTIFARERVPRRLHIEDRRSRLKTMEADIEPKLLEELLDASTDYETRWSIETF